MQRKYSDARFDAAQIAYDCLALGESSGWCGTAELQAEIAERLRPFSITYFDDLRGAWHGPEGTRCDDRK